MFPTGAKRNFFKHNLICKPSFGEIFAIYLTAEALQTVFVHEYAEDIYAT